MSKESRPKESTRGKTIIGDRRVIRINDDSEPPTDLGFRGRTSARLQRKNATAMDVLWEIAHATGTPEERAAKCQELAREFVGWRPL